MSLPITPAATSSRHMKTSPIKGGWMFFLDGVAGTPCGHFCSVDDDSSSNVTIFSRGFCIDIIGFWVIGVIGTIVCWMRFGGGGRAMSPTPLKLNSLTLRGTKYSIWLSRMPVERRAGVLRLNPV